jgi:hypothetical protein
MIGSRPLPLRVLPLLLLPLLARAEGSLTTESPFLPAGDAGATAQAASVVELRGIFEQGGQRYFNLVDAATRKGAWVALNESSPQGWTVRAYEQAGDTDIVTVEASGRTLRIPLSKPRAGKAAPGAAPAAVAAAPQPQGPVTPVVLNPTPAQQAKAQEDIMAEVRRRRLQRQQQGAAQPPPAQN